MKKIVCIIFVITCCIFITACGSEADVYEPVFQENNFSTEAEELPVTENEAIVSGEKEDLTEAPVPTETVEEVTEPEEADNSLQVNSKGLLSFDEINFLGESDILSLREERVKELLQENGMNITTNVERGTKFFDSTPLEIYGYFSDKTGTDVTVSQYDDKEYVSSWTFVHLPDDGGNKVSLGVRDVAMHNTFAEVLEKIGFQNTEKVEKKLYEMIGDVWFPDLEKSKIKEIQDFVNYSDNKGFFMIIDTGTYFIDNKMDSFQITIRNYSYMDGITPEKNIDLSFKFVRSEETDNKYILTQSSYSSW